MSRYYFSSAGGPRASQPELVELSDVEAAGREAIRRLGERMAADPSTLWNDDICSVVVTNEAGLTLFSVDASVSRAPAMAGLKARSEG